MLLLEVPTVTDWMQAWASIIGGVGAFIGIIAAIITLVNLKNDNKDNQKKIDSLAKYAEESQKQTAELLNQSKAMIELNAINLAMLETMKVDLEMQIDQRNEAKGDKAKAEKLAIMPMFESNGETSISGNGDIFLNLINKGERGRILSIHLNEATKVNFYTTGDLINVWINKGKIANLRICSHRDININGLNYRVSLHIEDSKRNQYIQNIEGVQGSFNISPPNEVIN